MAILPCPYPRTMKPYTQLELVGATDVMPGRAEKLVAEYGGRAYASLEEMLADNRVDLIVNLTIHHAHPEVITKCLNAGKHVHSEKPLAMQYSEANGWSIWRRKKGLRLSCCPLLTWVKRNRRSGRQSATASIVRVVYAEVNWGRIEAWHPNPGPFYDVGTLFDVGVYPLTLAATFFTRTPGDGLWQSASPRPRSRGRGV